MNQSSSTARPVGESDRIAALDILRGVALFGVLLVNFVDFAGPGTMATKAQMAALPTYEIDRFVHFAIEVLVGDKAMSIFAFLFGLGFYIQMQRGAARGGFERRYRRRLTILLVIGIANTLFLWAWDILNLYALAGFALLAMRGWKSRSLLVFGIIAACWGNNAQEALLGAFGYDPLVAWSSSSDPAVFERQALSQAGNYPGLVSAFWRVNLQDYLLTTAILAWMIYALGRFALGAWVGRMGLLHDSFAHLPLFRRIAAIAIPIGLVAALAVRLLTEGIVTPLFGMAIDWKLVGNVLRPASALVLAAGYISGLMVAIHTPLGGRLLAPFAPVGQMALTNYLAQGLIIAFVLFGVPPGLALAGKIGTTAILFISIAFFAAQMLFSRWWLARYRFGPMEWVWRSLTYGERPAMRRAELASAMGRKRTFG